MKNIFDYTHVKSVRAWVLIYKGEQAGKIVANFSDNPMGSVCTAQVIVWTGPLSKSFEDSDPGANYVPALGKAGGYGYDKFSAAVSDSLKKQGFDPKDMSGCGDGAVRSFFQDNGYTIMEAC